MSTGENAMFSEDSYATHTQNPSIPSSQRSTSDGDRKRKKDGQSSAQGSPGKLPSFRSPLYVALSDDSAIWQLHKTSKIYRGVTFLAEGNIHLRQQITAFVRQVNSTTTNNRSTDNKNPGKYTGATTTPPRTSPSPNKSAAKENASSSGKDTVSKFGTGDSRTVAKGSHGNAKDGDQHNSWVNTISTNPPHSDNDKIRSRTYPTHNSHPTVHRATSESNNVQSRNLTHRDEKSLPNKPLVAESGSLAAQGKNLPYVTGENNHSTPTFEAVNKSGNSLHHLVEDQRLADHEHPDEIEKGLAKILTEYELSEEELLAIFPPPVKRSLGEKIRGLFAKKPSRPIFAEDYDFDKIIPRSAVSPATSDNQSDSPGIGGDNDISELVTPVQGYVFNFSELNLTIVDGGSVREQVFSAAEAKLVHKANSAADRAAQNRQSLEHKNFLAKTQSVSWKVLSTILLILAHIVRTIGYVFRIVAREIFHATKQLIRIIRVIKNTIRAFILRIGKNEKFQNIFLRCSEYLIAFVFGGAIFFSFIQLWKWEGPRYFTLALAMIVLLVIITIVIKFRKFEDNFTMILAIITGLLITFGPLVLLRAIS